MRGCGEVEQRFHPSVLGPGPVDSPPQRQNKLAKRAGACSSNGERDSDPASPMTYATGNQPRPWRGWSAGGPRAIWHPRLLHGRQQPVVRWRGAALPPGRAPVRKTTRAEWRADIPRGITYRTSHVAGAVEANGLVPLGLCGHCGRVSQQVPLQSRTGRNPAARRYSVYVEIVPSSPVYPMPVYKLGLIVSTRSHIRVMRAQI